MGRLSSSEREQLRRNIDEIYQECMDIIRSEVWCSRNIYKLTEEEVLLCKYRMCFCIKLLQRYGLADRFSNIRLIDIQDSINGFRGDKEEIAENMLDLVYDMGVINELYLDCCLKGTMWKIYYVGVLSDYEELDEDVLKGMKDIVEMHWYSMVTAAEFYYCDEDFESENEYLTSLGFEPQDSFLDLPDYNLILCNERVREMLRLCSENKELRSWPEYQELDKVRTFTLLDRRFIGLNNYDLSNENWNCISYIMGEVGAATDEGVGMHQLCYEAVLYLILADMVAEEFLEKYHARQKEVVA